MPVFWHLVLNEIQEKAEYIPRVLYRHFDPYVFTFNLETETVSTLIITLDALRAARVKKRVGYLFRRRRVFIFFVEVTNGNR